jgi:hypothetical protein
MQKQAGIEISDHIGWFRDHPEEDDLKLLKWSDDELGDSGYVDWYLFDHPQLGPVELGGWNTLYTWRNPPPHLLEAEIAPLADFAIFNCLISPKLEKHSLSYERRGKLHTIQLVLHNTGWLPTNVSHKALEMKAVRDLEVDIRLPEGASLVTGQLKTNLGQLVGRDDKRAMAIWGGDATKERVKIEWVVEAEEAGKIELIATHQRAGIVRATVNLE